MRRIIPVIIALSLISSKCEPEIEFLDNERLLFTGTVVDIGGNPIQNIPVEIYASRNFFDPSFSSIEANDEFLGSEVTDSDGTFSFISLSPSNALNIYALVNYNNRQVQSRTPIVLNSINELEQNDFTYDLGSLIIDDLRNFNFGVERLNNAADTLNYSLRYKPEITSIDFDENNTLFPILRTCFSLNSKLLPSSDTRNHRLKVRESDTIFMEYRLINGAVQEMDTLKIVVNENSNNFVFSF